jgi:hypothetical protein
MSKGLIFLKEKRKQRKIHEIFKLIMMTGLKAKKIAIIANCFSAHRFEIKTKPLVRCIGCKSKRTEK